MNRTDYLDGKVDHQTYYQAIADVIGRAALERMVLEIAPFDKLKEAHESDEHLNGIPLWSWDSRHARVNALVASNAKAVMALSWIGEALKPGTYAGVRLGADEWHAESQAQGR